MNSDGGPNQDLLPRWRFGNLSMPLVAVMRAIGKAARSQMPATHWPHPHASQIMACSPSSQDSGQQRLAELLEALKHRRDFCTMTYQFSFKDFSLMK